MKACKEQPKRKPKRPKVRRCERCGHKLPGDWTGSLCPMKTVLARYTTDETEWPGDL